MSKIFSLDSSDFYLLITIVYSHIKRPIPICIASKNIIIVFSLYLLSSIKLFKMEWNMKTNILHT